MLIEITIPMMFYEIIKNGGHEKINNNKFDCPVPIKNTCFYQVLANFALPRYLFIVSIDFNNLYPKSLAY